jgi:POT family proton-dependent oligopeptide transporter
MANIEAGKKERTLFGHPIGLTWLFGTEMWERFSYYGMRTILVLYLAEHLLLPGNVEHVFGYHAIQGFFEYTSAGFSYIGILIWNLFAAHGAAPNFTVTPIGGQPLSSLIYGLYTALVYLTPFFGGMLADRVWGQRYTVIVGAILMAIGEFALTFDSLCFVGLLFLILGNGAFKPNISTQVGGLYKEGDSRIDRAYSIFYVGINAGAALGSFLCGLFGEKYGWHYGFATAGVGMILGLIIYLFALRSLPADRVSKVKAGQAQKKPLTRLEWRSVYALIVLCIPTTFFWATYEQSGNTINFWAKDFTDRWVHLPFLNFEIPVTSFQSFNPVMIFLFTPIVIGFWGWQTKRRSEPSTVTKMALGCILIALANLILAGAAFLTGAHGTASWLWLLAYFVVLTFGELYLSPIGLALVARIAPVQILSMMMGMWFITSFTGNLLQGVLGSMWSGMDKTNFFLMIAAIAAGAGLVIWIFDRPLRPILEAKPEKPLPALEPQ